MWVTNGNAYKKIKQFISAQIFCGKCSCNSCNNSPALIIYNLGLHVISKISAAGFKQCFLKVYRTYEDGSEVSYSVRVKVGEEGAELPVITADDKAAKKPVETRYAIQRIENSVDSLSPKRKMAYHFCGAAMVVIPIIFSIAGILLCGFFFYRRKLLLPLGMLSEATQQILDQNLDFNLRYDSEDEWECCAAHSSR